MSFIENQQSCLDGAATASSYNGGFEFKNGANTTTEYAYNVNGNTTKYLNKNIIEIQYNFLNLPSKVTFGDGSAIAYLYSADKRKLRTTHTVNATFTKTYHCDKKTTPLGNIW